MKIRNKRQNKSFSDAKNSKDAKNKKHKQQKLRLRRLRKKDPHDHSKSMLLIKSILIT